MSEENNFLSVSNNVIIEGSSKSKENNFTNLLNPDTSVK